VEHKIPVYEGKIIFPQTYKGKFFYAMVLEVADDCNKTITKESMVLIEWNGNKKQLDGNIWLVDESSILLVKREAKWCPIGRKVMIIRDNKEKRTSAGLIITDQLKENTQSLYGTIMAFGWDKNVKVEHDLQIGDYICLTEWKPTHKEIALYDNYILVVDIKDIACKIEKVNDA
jgi:co-chaperonin GroES (HSP10)